MNYYEEKKLLDKAFLWAIDYLQIKIPPKFSFEQLDSSIFGQYDYGTNEVILNIYTKFPESIEVLFHELVHCKQFQQGWLRIEEEKFYWKKKINSKKYYKIENWENYYNSPHERQARDVSKEMMSRYSPYFLAK